VVTCSTRDYVESRIEVTHQRVSFLSVWIENILDNFVWDITANDFYNVVGYSLPRCDLRLHMEHKYTVNTQYDVLVKQVSLVLIVFQLLFSWN